jgi:hypothetical protein
VDDGFLTLLPATGAELERNLRYLIGVMREGIGGELVSNEYWINTEIPFTDFSLEIVPPATNEVYPMGVLGIHVGNHAWTVAAIPYVFRGLPLEALIYIIWPQYAECLDDEN